jgi:hypothetical protein
MALAYLILAHKNPRQVARLFRAVHHPDDVVVLHFDRRADRALHQLGAELAGAHPNVRLLRPRPILWGGYQMAAAQIEAMAAALRADAVWHHFINLTGQDFPIKPRAQLEAHLAARTEASFVSWFDPLRTSLWANARERLTRHHVEWAWLDRLLRVPGLGRQVRRIVGGQNRLPHVPGYRRRWPGFFHYYGGANHVVLSRAACRHLTESPDARRIIRWLRPAGHANEIIYQSVLLNSPLAGTIVNGHLWEIDFPPHAPHPRTLTTADYDRLLRSPRYFARKFDESVDARVLDQLTEHLGVAAAEAVPAPPA